MHRSFAASMLLLVLSALQCRAAVGGDSSSEQALQLPEHEPSMVQSSAMVAQPAARPQPNAKAVNGDAALVTEGAISGINEDNSLLIGSDGGARQLRFTVPGLQDNTSGPLFPYFYDDLPPNEAEAFRRPTAQPTADLRSLLSSVSTPIPGCNYTKVPGCGTTLTACLLQDPVDRELVCSCYYDRGQCLRKIGCYDTMSRAELNYCFNELRCSMDACEGITAGAAAVRVAASVAVAAVVAFVALLAPGGGG